MAHGGRAREQMGGGAPESSVGATKGALLPPFGLLAGDDGGDGGRRGEVAHGGRARGEMGGGAPESSVGAINPNNWSDLAGDDGEAWGGMGGGVGRWPMEGGQGGRWVP